MKGSVKWSSKHLQETWHGEVTKCMQQGDKLNVAFKCENIGEGEITLAITPDDQVYRSSYYYYGVLGATLPQVRGRLSFSPGHIYFSGTWTDPKDGTGMWDFEIKITGHEVVESVATACVPEQRDNARQHLIDELLERLVPDYFTPWYEEDVTPLRTGIYRVTIPANYRTSSGFAYAFWDGSHWGGATDNVGQLTNASPVSGFRFGDDYRSWSGLTESGHRQILSLLVIAEQSELESKNRHRLGNLRDAENEVDTARSAAHNLYRQFWAESQEPPGLDNLMPNAPTRTELEKFAPDFTSPPAGRFDEFPLDAPEEMNIRLTEALASCREQMRYWSEYWEIRLRREVDAALSSTSKGLVVGYGDEMKERIGKNSTAKPLAGSYGSGRRR